MLWPDFLAGGKQQSEVDDIFQLADVARPGVRLERAFRGRADLGKRQLQLASVEIEEVPRQRHDIALPLAQRREARPHDVQPII